MTSNCLPTSSRRVDGVHVDAEAHARSFMASRSVRPASTAWSGLLQASSVADRRGHTCVLDEVAADANPRRRRSGLHRDRLLRDLRHLADLVRHSMRCASSSGGLATHLLEHLPRDAVELLMASIMCTGIRIGLVGDRARDRLADPPRRTSRTCSRGGIRTCRRPS